MSNLKAAIKYAARGWPVFPLREILIGSDGVPRCTCGAGANCDRIGKHPATKNGFKDASTDEDTVREWWMDTPNAGIGIATGQDSGLSVLDIDGNEGLMSLAKLQEGNAMPETIKVRTGSGGYHYYFNYNKDVKSKSKIAEGVDTRSDGGYVVAPPSGHVSGNKYKYEGKGTALADWPEWILAEKKEKGKVGRPPKPGKGFNINNPQDITKLKDALEHIDQTQYDNWYKVALALGREFEQSDKGFDIFNEWAMKAGKDYDYKGGRGRYYDQSKERRGDNKDVLIGTVWTLASEAGWVPKTQIPERAIHIFEDELDQQAIVNDLIHAAALAPNIFQNSGQFVHIIKLGKSRMDGVEYDESSYMMTPHSALTLSCFLTEQCCYWKLNAKGEHTPKALSLKYLNMLLELRQFSNGEDNVKTLSSFASHPILRADGSVASAYGYDAQSQMFVTEEFDSKKYKDGLTPKASAKLVDDVMLAPFKLYKWRSDLDKAVFVSAIFTVGLRHLFKTAPLYAFSAPIKGSGKTKLVDSISQIWFGTNVAHSTYTQNEEEQEKRYVAFLLTRQRMHSLDNVPPNTSIDSPTINKILTSSSVEARVLGSSTSIQLENKTTFFATGNNMVLNGDISRRALIAYVDPDNEDPSSKAYPFDPVVKALEMRKEIIACAISIAMSWVKAGRPGADSLESGMGSFDSWERFIRPMVIWLGLGDVAFRHREVLDDDESDAAEHMFLVELFTAFGPEDRALSTPDVVRLMRDSLALAFKNMEQYKAQDRYSKAEAVGVTITSVGRALKKVERKVFVAPDDERKFKLERVCINRKNKSFGWQFFKVDEA